MAGHDALLPLALVSLPLRGVVVVKVEGSEPDPLVPDVGPGVDSAGLPLERPEAVPLSGPEISSVRVSS